MNDQENGSYTHDVLASLSWDHIDPTLVQTILHVHVDNYPNIPPTDIPTHNTLPPPPSPQCENDR